MSQPYPNFVRTHYLNILLALEDAKIDYPSIFPISPMNDLFEEHKGSDVMKYRKEEISQQFCSYRKVKGPNIIYKFLGDGDCYYRSVMYRYMEYLICQGKKCLEDLLTLYFFKL